MIAMKAVLPTRIGDAIGARISGLNSSLAEPREPDASERPAPTLRADPAVIARRASNR